MLLVDGVEHYDGESGAHNSRSLEVLEIPFEVIFLEGYSFNQLMICFKTFVLVDFQSLKF